MRVIPEIVDQATFDASFIGTAVPVVATPVGWMAVQPVQAGKVNPEFQDCGFGDLDDLQFPTVIQPTE